MVPETFVRDVGIAVLIVHLPPPAPPPATSASGKMGLPRPLYNQLRRRYFDGVRWLRQQGIY